VAAGRPTLDTLTVLALAAGRTEQIDVVVAWGDHGDFDARLRVRRGKFIEARDIRHHIAEYTCATTSRHRISSHERPRRRMESTRARLAALED
jgi:hypothetical protein